MKKVDKIDLNLTQHYIHLDYFLFLYLIFWENLSREKDNYHDKLNH